MNRRWICNDVWMDIFPCFDRPQLGLKLALLSPRFNALVDKHFDGKRELTIWRHIAIRRNNSVTAVPESSVIIDFDNSVPFPLPDRPLPSKIRFKHLQIRYIDHSVFAFLRSNHQIFDKRGTNLQLFCVHLLHTTDGQRIWDVFVREIWPIFASNIRHLGFIGGNHLDNLRRLISPTILIDLNQLTSIDIFGWLPEAIDDFDGPNAIISAGQALSKWLNSPRKDGQPKRLRCALMNQQAYSDWVNNFKEQFLRATISSVSYQIHFNVRVPSIQIVPFELVNEWTKEKLTLAMGIKNELGYWIMKRCKIIGETAAVKQQQKKDENLINNCNNVSISLSSCTNFIGPLSPPPAEEEEAGQSITNGSSSSADK